MVIDKKGQQMSLSTIIVIILGIAVLVFLIFGFTTGWNNLWDRVTQFTGGSSNVDAVVQACAVKCASQDKYGFCQENRTVTLEDGKSLSANCNDFSKKVTFSKGTETSDVSIGVDACPNLC